MSHFESLSLLPPDPILGLVSAFKECKNPNKVNLGVGAYKNSEGNPLVLSAVRKAEIKLLEQELFKEYLPINGLDSYCQELLKLIFDISLPSLEHVFAAQTLGGTGALKVGADFLKSAGFNKVYISSPSWPNHKPIFSRAGFKVEAYSYYNMKTHQLMFDEMCEDIKKMEPHSVILLQACCHNPSGIDPSPVQWEVLSSLIKEQQLIPFFDMAYQGLGKNLVEDVFSVRLFAEKHHEMLLSYSCSKNFGLYGERVGLLTIISENKEITNKVESQAKVTIRTNYSNPPSHGAHIVSTILQDPLLKKEWHHELENMCDRLEEMRKALLAELQSKGRGVKDFNFMNKQQGMFSFSGLNEDQVEELKQTHGIFMPKSGRINIAGLNWKNLEYVVEAIVSIL